MAKQDANNTPPQPAPAPEPAPQPAPQKASTKEVIDALRDRLGIERSTRDVLKENLREIEKSLIAIEKQNAKLETANRDTINIKSINAELLKTRQEQYVVGAKISEAEKKLGSNLELSKSKVQDYNEQLNKRKDAEDAYNKARTDAEQVAKDLGMAEKTRVLELYNTKKNLLQELSDLQNSEAAEQESSSAEEKRIQKIAAAEKSARQDIELAEKEHAKQKDELSQKSIGVKQRLAQLESRLSTENLTKAQRGQIEADKYELENQKKLLEEKQRGLDASLSKQIDIIEAVRLQEEESANATAEVEKNARAEAIKSKQEEINQIEDSAQKTLSANQTNYLSSLQNIDAAKQAFAIEEQKSANIKDSLSDKDLEYAALLKQQEVQQKQNELIQEKKKFEEEVQSNLGLTGNIMKNIVDKLKVGEGVYGVMTERARQLTEQNAKSEDKMSKIAIRYQVLKAGAKQMVDNAKDLVKTPEFWIGAAVGAYKASKAGLDAMGNAAAKAGGALKSMSADSASVFSDLAKPALDLISKIPYVGGLLAGIGAGIASLLDLVTGVNDALIKTGRTLGMSYETVKKMNESFQDYSVKSGSIYNTSKKLLESYSEISKELGVITELSAKDLETNIKLRDFAALDLATRTKLQVMAKTSGKDAEAVTKSIVAQVAQLKNATGVQINQQKVLTEVTKLSGVLGLEFSKYPEKITAAYVQLKAMGMELSTLEQKADGFLDFQSSIQKEFEAQLVTGKEINLSKVRELVLNNKIADAGLLIAKQVGSSKEFLKMTRVEQQTFASAIEMSRDELANMLREQEQMAAFGATTTDEVKKQVELLRQQKNEQEAIAKLGSKEAYDAMTKATLQEKIAAFIEKIKQSLVDFVERTGLIEKIEKMFEFLENPDAIKNIIYTVRDVFAGVAEVVLNIVTGIMKALNMIGAVSDKEYVQLLKQKSTIPDKIRSVGGESLSASGSTEEKQAEKIENNKFQVGGYTGDGPINKPAGIVHKGEYVVNAQTTKALGGESGVKEMVANRMTSNKTSPAPSTEPAPNIKQILEGIKGAMDKNVIVNLHLDGKQIASVTSDTFQKSPFRATTISPLFLEGA